MIGAKWHLIYCDHEITKPELNYMLSDFNVKGSE